MEKELKNAFKKAQYEVDPNLPTDIWRTIIKRDKRINRIKLWAFSLMGAISFVGVFPAFKILLTDLTQSGFYEYVSLALSSNGVLFSYPKELFFSLAETLPTTSVILSLSLVLVLFLSLKYMTREIIKGQLSLSY